MKDESKDLGSVYEPANLSKHDIKYCTAVSREIFKFIGIWTMDKNVGTFEKIFTATRVILCYLLMLFLFIPCALHIFLDEKDYHKKVKSLGPLIYHLTAIAKLSFLVARKRDIHQCLYQVRDDFQHGNCLEHRKIMINSAKISRLIVVVCIIFTYSCTIFFRLVMPLCAGKRVGPNNITIRPLGTPVYKPFLDATESPTYEIVYIMQTTSSFVISSITIAASNLTALFVFHACGQLKIVMNRLNSFVVDRKSVGDLLENRMAGIVESHLRVLKFIERVESVLNEVCLIEFIAAIINICLMLYYLVTEFEEAETIAVIGYCVIVVSITFNIFILCYIGEMLGEQVKNVGSTAYMMDWYKLPEKNARGLIILLAMTNYPCRITAGKMAELSFRSFSGLMKTSMGYFNLLRKITS